MTPENVLDIRDRAGFRRWLADNHDVAGECWLAVKRGKTAPADALWYLDAVEEALCFGWIDSTLKNVDGVALQRFGPRKKSSAWSELNKERVRRLEKLGLMTDSGRRVCPDLQQPCVVMDEVAEAFEAHPVAWENFKAMPPLYQRVRIDNVQRVKSSPEMFRKRLDHLIRECEKGRMFGNWHDSGRLLDY